MREDTKKCREAIPREEEGGKVVIIEMVTNEKLLMDVIMLMTVVNGREKVGKSLLAFCFFSLEFQ